MKLFKLNFVNIRRAYRTVTDRYGYRPSIRTNPKTQLPTADQVEAQKNHSLHRFINAYRTHGHRIAKLNPLITCAESSTETISDEKRDDLFKVGELDQTRYGLTEDSASVNTHNLLASSPALEPKNVKSLKSTLEAIYCGTFALEFEHVRARSETEYFWLAREFELAHATPADAAFTPAEHSRLARLMLESQAFDNFLATKFPTTKRYGGEGAEPMLVFIDALLNAAAKNDISDVVIGMPHRGRLNLLTSMLKFPPAVLFRKVKGLPEFNSRYNDAMCGDVLSHLFQAVDLQVPQQYGDAAPLTGETHKIRVSLMPNPSHLEAILPVTLGKVRAKMQRYGVGDYGSKETDRPGDRVLPLHLHGDAAFCGQGIVPEAIQQSGDCPHFGVGGSVHLVVNNQIGYTTQADCARTSQKCTDVAKMVGAPCLHVNASDVAAVVHSAQLAAAYRHEFRKDIFINLVCFRKHGHNEMDDASQTQPLMARAIKERKSLPDEHAEYLVTHNICQKADLKVNKFVNYLNEEFAKVEQIDPPDTQFKGPWEGLGVASRTETTTWHTGADLELLREVGQKSMVVKDKFSLHPTLQSRVLPKRMEALKTGQNLDWATAETLAVGSLLLQGFNVRLAGQDVQRGTFAQRHWGITDYHTDELYVPLNNLSQDQKGKLEVANTPLNELAAMGFEYGFSLSAPNTLTMWEAQFGDFFNGAQIVIDTFVTSGEAKWMHQSGLVLLLPHGMDGAGPEHSSCRMERFLQLTDSRESGPIGDSDHVNFYVANPTTPAQYFHLLRLQMGRNFRKPLVVVGPKMLLTHRAATSTLADMGPGTFFKPVFDDPVFSGGADRKTVNKVVLVSGKHFYTLDEHAKQLGGDVRQKTAIIRLERLCPFPANEISEIVKQYPNAMDVVWSQEEQQNCGAWSFVQPRLRNFCGLYNIRYVGRQPLACPATGCGSFHKKEAAEILKATFS